MAKNDDPQKIIEAYKRRQKIMPFVMYGISAVLIVAGIIILLVWLLGGDQPKVSLFATDTPTPTSTVTHTPVTPTNTPTNTPTETMTPTITLTPTRSGPVEYQIEEGDNCYSIAESFEVDMLVLLAINNFDAGTCPIQPGDTIIIPAIGQELPTATPWPEDLPKGTILPYTVQFGDSLDLIAIKFFTTVEIIMEENELENANQINAGDVLQIPVNMITKTPTPLPTVTPTP